MKVAQRERRLRELIADPQRREARITEIELELRELEATR
jgi:hypothetical protein